MKALAFALAVLLIAAEATIACSVVEVVETLPSSPNVRLTVFKDGIPQQNATLVVALQTSGQEVGPALATDARGRAELQNLTPGTYCISATADSKLGAVLCLVVSSAHHRKRSEFSLQLAPLPPPPPTLAEQLEQASKSPPQVRARAFEGIVTDVAGAPIPRAGLVVYVHRSGRNPSLIRLEADAHGQFSVPLNPGRYAAAFQSPGFQTRLVGFEIAPDESQESVPIVLQIGSCT
jgi:hypothetical protein